MDNLDFNSLRKYWSHHLNADDRQGNDKTGSEKSREPPKLFPKPKTKIGAKSQNASASTNNLLTPNAPVSSTLYGPSEKSREPPKPRTKIGAKSQNASAKCTNNPLIHHAPLSSTLYGSPDVSNGLTTLVPHKQDFFKRYADEIASKKSTKCIDNSTTQYAPLSTSSDISRGTNRIDYQRPVTDVLAKNGKPFSCQPNITPADKRTLMNKPSLNHMEIRWNSRLIQQMDNDEECGAEKVDEHYTSILDRETLAKHHSKMDKTPSNHMEITDNLAKNVTPFRCQYNITPADKKQTPFEKRTPIGKRTPFDKQSNAIDSSKGDKGTTAKYHSKMDKRPSNHMEMRWNNRLKQQVDTDEECGAKKVNEHYTSILDRETLAKYHSQGARPKDSDLAETRVRRNGATKEASAQSKYSSSNPDLAEINRRKSKVNLKFVTSQTPSYQGIVERTSRQREICQSMLPERNEKQSNSSSVIETRKELGNIKDDKIADSGKSLMEIPLEPRFVCMINMGYENGLVYDTIVLAALCSSTDPIFYRSDNDQQKKVHDLKKLKFCDPKGDAFTYLKIYKDWEQVPESQKNAWCFDNDLNSRLLREARELVDKICSIFEHNWRIEVKQNFSTKVNFEEVLQKIILFAFYENIAHFLGHVKIGYYIPNLQQRVFIHPSSALYSLNDSSQWLVFINILKTPRDDCITLLTPVEESWIRWATGLKTKQFDIDEAKNRSVCSIRSQFFGPTTYSFFVGQANKNKYEDKLYEAVQVPVAIDPDQKTGEIKFICGFNATLPDDLIDDWIAEAKRHVIQRCADIKVGSNDQTRVRIVLGLGGECQLILMPDEYRTVHIKSWNKETNETVLDKFKRFGQIVDCRWGRVSFSTPEAAAEAVRITQDDPNNAAAPEFKIRKHASFQYIATIEWLRPGRVIREKTLTNPNELSNFRQQIYDQFQGFDQDMKFVVDVMTPRDNNVNFRAYIKFDDVSQGTMACEALQGRLTINGQQAQITATLSTSISVPEKVYQLLGKKIQEFFKKFKEYGTKLTTKKFNDEKRMLHISASNLNYLMHIRKGVSAITHGTVIEGNESNRYLFLKSGRNILRSLEEKTNTIIQLDNRQLILRVFGMQNNIILAQRAIDQYRQNVVEGDSREIKLNDESQPKGLMRTLVTRYDLELEGFVQASGLQSASLNHRNQTLKICGDAASMEKAIGLIDSFASKLRKKTTKSQSEELPECCACLLAVETLDQLYRLDACGHVYCLECIKQQIAVAVQRKEVPVLCVDCQDPLVWSDFTRLHINPLDLANTAMSVYMTKNKDGYRYCPTPDCPMVYRCTEKSDIFNCNECNSRICTSCHVEYHDGLTCAELKSSVDELQLEEYLKENASRVKKCPKCSILIEKSYGCNHMICHSCKIDFCWLCCETFNTERATYNHLNAHHGGVFDEAELLRPNF